MNPKEPLKIPLPTRFLGKLGTLRTYLTQLRLYLCFQQSALLGTHSNKVLAIAAYLNNDAAIWFEPLLREYLEKGNANHCSDPVKAIFNSYNEYE